MCYPGFEEKLRKAAVGKEAVVTDGRITTSRGMGTAIAFGLELISLLRGKETSEKVRESILYTLETPRNVKKVLVFFCGLWYSITMTVSMEKCNTFQPERGEPDGNNSRAETGGI